MDSHTPEDAKPPSKQPVVRGARACTVCRAAKMKCVGAEDGLKQCQRCARSGAECIFEKHRRGRKPGSKLSEASKMLRKLEKGLTSAKMKSQAAQATMAGPYPTSDSRSGVSSDGQFRIDLPPLQVPYHGGPSGSNYHGRHGIGSPPMDIDDEEDEDDEGDHKDETMYPQKLIERNSFFNTVLLSQNGSAGPPAQRLNGGHSVQERSFVQGPAPQLLSTPALNAVLDPVQARIMDESTAKILFDSLFLRLNPFVNLFDPELHSVDYVRKRSPFLFTTILMAGSKFWKPDVYAQCYKLAHEMAGRAFIESWKGVEVVQAFACLMYWKEPDDTRTWTYIGYACRMAVELGLNRYVAKPPENESHLQRLERRNRERTYLVLFVHDRSLSTQTGRQWMLPEDDLVRNAGSWYEQVPPGTVIRPEDVIVSAQVGLRKISAETTEFFNAHKSQSPAHDSVDSYSGRIDSCDILLGSCNQKLDAWRDAWLRTMDRANGHPFHKSFLNFFHLHVRLFLNSFGIQNSLAGSGRGKPTSLQALAQCYDSAVKSLVIVTEDFARVQVLQYGQDSVTIITAYSSVFLLKLLRSPSTMSQLNDTAAEEIHSLITRAADAYQDAASIASSSSSAAYHSRFLRSLVAKDKEMKTRQLERERCENVAIDPILQNDPGRMKYRPSSSRVTLSGPSASLPTPPQMYPSPPQGYSPPASDHSFRFPTSPHLPSHPVSVDQSIGAEGGYHSYSSHMQAVTRQSSESDLHYWHNMFREIGFGANEFGPSFSHERIGEGEYVAYASQEGGMYHHGMGN